MTSMMFKEKKKLARNEASRALKKYAKMVKREGLESDRVKVDKAQLVALKMDEGGGKCIDNVQGAKVVEDEKYIWKSNGYTNIGGDRIVHTDERDDDMKEVKGGNKKNVKHNVKKNPFERQQRQAEEKAVLRAQRQEERRKTQAIIKEKQRIREAKKRKFLRQKKPHVGGQIGRLLEKIQESIS